MSIREYYDGDDGQLKPGRKGVCYNTSCLVFDVVKTCITIIV